MMKKLMMALCFMFASVHPQDFKQEDFDQQETDLAFQELIYDMGVVLAVQNPIVNNATGTQALINLYNQVEQVNQIVDLFMMIDEELVDLDITTIEDLIDYEINQNEPIAQSCIAWLAAYQKVFTIFLEIHGQQASFIDWCHDMAFVASLDSDTQLEDPSYEALWQAVYEVLQAQKVFEAALQELE
jgi:hypothetical protein